MFQTSTKVKLTKGLKTPKATKAKKQTRLKSDSLSPRKLILSVSITIGKNLILGYDYLIVESKYMQIKVLHVYRDEHKVPNERVAALLKIVDICIHANNQGS